MSGGALYRIGYFIRTSLNSIAQNPVMNAVAAGTIAVAILIFSIFLLVQVNLQNLVQSSTEELSLSAYLKDGLSAPALKRLRESAADLPGVSRVDYVSKEQALEDLKKRLGDQGSLLEGLPENPLPASLELRLEPGFRDKAKVEPLTVSLSGLDGVEEVRYAWEWAEKLEGVIRFVRLAGLVMGGLLFLAVIFIVSNTIKLTVLARRDELYILRLVGATESFIRIPFIMEGLLQGFCGSLTAVGLLFILFHLVAAGLDLPLGLSMVELSFLPVSTCWFLVSAGLGLGFVGSFLSLGRFMRT